MIVEYHGGAFYGWQWQPGLRTVQAELERVLSVLQDEPVTPVYSSGRTDAGVHARRQVVNFHTSKPVDLFKLPFSVSSMLKGDLAVVKADIVPETFHSRKSARSKQYSYKILNRPAPPTFEKGCVWHIGVPLDVVRMQKEVKSFIGLHDFSSFRGANCQASNPEREIYECELLAEGSDIKFRVMGSGFLQYMVRIMVGTLVQFGRGNLSDTSIKEILAAKNRKFAGPTAPAHGLYLDWVETKEGERQ